MRQLDYARDNRLRLWFLGVEDSRALDGEISPRKDAFLKLMEQCAAKSGGAILKPERYCILVVGDGSSEVEDANLPLLISGIAMKADYTHVLDHTKKLFPMSAASARGLTEARRDKFLILRNNGCRADSRRTEGE